jgi:hypothetical protein
MDTHEVMFLAVAGFALIFAVVVIVTRMEARKRAAALQTVAQEMGFQFIGEKWEPKLKGRQIGTALFTGQSGPKFKNIMTGVAAGFETSLFDYSYSINDGESSRTCAQTVAAFTQSLWLPHFELRPEGLLDRIGEAFVHRDIDFDSHPDFSRRYFLQGTDQAGIRKLFGPSLLTFLEQLPADEKWHIEGNLCKLIIYQSGVEVEPDEFPSFVEKTSSISKTFFSSPTGLNRPVR